MQGFYRKDILKFLAGAVALVLFVAAIAHLQPPKPEIDLAEYVFPVSDTSVTLTEKKGASIRHNFHRPTSTRVEDLVTVSTEGGTPDHSLNTYHIEGDGIYLISSHNAVSNQDDLHVLKYPRFVQENHEYKNLGKVTRVNFETSACNLVLGPCIEFSYSGESVGAKEIYCKGFGKISFQSESTDDPEVYECSAIAH